MMKQETGTSIKRTHFPAFHLWKNGLQILFPVLLFFFMAGCAVQPANPGGFSAKRVDPSKQEDTSGLGIGSSDLIKMSRKMAADILADPQFQNRRKPPVIIIDDTRFLNESTQVLDINMLLDRIRINLIRAARGKLRFKSRKNLDLALKEKIIAGVKITEADYWMIGRISSFSSVSNKSGIRSNFLQFSFELLDLATSNAVWGNIYEIKKIGADDAVYR